MKVLVYIVCSVSIVLFFQNCGDLQGNNNDSTDSYDLSLFPAPIENLLEDEIQVGDMILQKDGLEMEEADSEVGTAGMSAIDPKGFMKNYRWKNGIMPVRFGGAITADQRETFFGECEKWGKLAQFDCTLRTDENYYLSVGMSGEGCNSGVGRAYGGKRITRMNLAPSCWNERTVLHEIGHALGLMHEHQRHDRNEYIRILRENIPDGYDHAFDRYKPYYFTKEMVHTDYDFKSVMHYSNRGPGSEKTFVPRKEYKALFQQAMAGRDDPEVEILSKKDKIAAAKIYGYRNPRTQFQRNYNERVSFGN